LFRSKKTGVVDLVLVIYIVMWTKGVRGVKVNWKVREGQLIPSKGPEWMGIHHHGQDISLPSKWGLLYLSMQGVIQVTKQLIKCFVKIKI
jgi:hypothetical protein